VVRTDVPRKLAAELVGVEVVSGVSIAGESADGGTLVVTSPHAGELAAVLPGVARKVGARLREVKPLDDSLESVFRELLR
jgi:ABC-2 type transport system ATP-binding protein